MFTVAREFSDDIKSDIEPLIKSHWSEVDIRGRSCEMSPDWDMYASMEIQDISHLITVRDDDKLVGYLNMLVSKSPHTQIKQAAVDLLYVLPEYRGSGVVDDLIVYSEEFAKTLGCQFFTLSLIKSHPHDNLMVVHGYEHWENSYGKCLLKNSDNS